MVLLTVTPEILQAIATIPEIAGSDLESFPDVSGSPVEHKTIVTISRLAKKNNGCWTLNSLLRGTKVYVPPPPVKAEPSPEYVALMARLRREKEQREYVALLSKETQDIDQDLSEEKDDISPSLVFNILISIVMCAGVTFHVTRFWTNDGIRVLASLFVGIVVGVAEVTVYASYLRKVEESRAKERAKKEQKKVIGEYKGEDMLEEVSLDTKSQGKEEIWGRGLNGGMRRRVREKWEKERSDT